MDLSLEQFIEAEFTKINFVLEALWANVMVNHGASPKDVDELRDILLRQFRELPATNLQGEQVPPSSSPVSKAAAVRIETFFAHVRKRVETAHGPSSLS